jgi:uncharacterized membrane protein
VIGPRSEALASLVAMLLALSCGGKPQVAPSPGGSPTPATPPPRTDTPAGPTIGTVAGCPGGNGIHISTTSGALTRDSAGVNTVIGLRESVDTTLVFNISSKSWTRTNLAAAISVGLADETRGRYAICAGITALLPSATLTINGARGRVHFAASLKDLSNALRLGPGR